MSVTYYTFAGNQLDAIHFHNLCVIVFRDSKFDYHTRNYCTATRRGIFHGGLSTHQEGRPALRCKNASRISKNAISKIYALRN
jgi:hypothetical protein